jgi:hypothetical protein
MESESLRSELNCLRLRDRITPLNERKTLMIELRISHRSLNTQYVDGFLHLWAFYVRGFNPRFHCQKAFRGQISQRIKTRSTPLNTALLLGETRSYDTLYICGVAQGPVIARRERNLHLALEFSDGASLIHTTYNGYQLHIDNAIALPIPELPKNWRGLPDSYTRCCNFRFCVYRFGFQD